MLSLDALRRREKADTCHLCGLPKTVCRDRAIEKELKVEFERCHVSTAIVKMQESLSRESNGQAAIGQINALEFIPLLKSGEFDLLGDAMPEALQ